MKGCLKYGLFVVLAFSLFSCEVTDDYNDVDYERDDDAFITSNVSSITSNSAVVEGNISTNGGSVHVYYSTSKSSVGKYNCEYNDGIARDYCYSIDLQGLESHTKYYYEACYDGASSTGSFTTK